MEISKQFPYLCSKNIIMADYTKLRDKTPYDFTDDPEILKNTLKFKFQRDQVITHKVHIIEILKKDSQTLMESYFILGELLLTGEELNTFEKEVRSQFEEEYNKSHNE